MGNLEDRARHDLDALVQPVLGDCHGVDGVHPLSSIPYILQGIEHNTNLCDKSHMGRLGVTLVTEGVQTGCWCPEAPPTRCQSDEKAKKTGPA